MTVRRKDGDRKNWAFVTFADTVGMVAALAEEISVDGGGGERATLKVKQARVDKVTRRQTTTVRRM